MTANNNNNNNNNNNKKNKNKSQNGGGTALAIVDAARYPALDPNSDMREALSANMQGDQLAESDLVRVPTPAGGSTRWVLAGVTGEQVLDELTGVLVYYCARGLLWPTEEVSNAMPLLLSHDLITAVRVGDDYGDIDPDELEQYRVNEGEPAQYDWLALPWNQWRSAKNGIGKRCKESRLLFVLREDEPFPCLVRAQPGSLKTVRPFVMRLPVPHWRAVVSLRLQVAESKAGPKYSQIVPRLVGTLDKAAGEQLMQLYTGPLRRMAAGMLASDREQQDEE